MIDLAVIMSIYINDRLNFVRESVQSILKQTYLQFDYYLIFDGPVQPDVERYINSLSDERIKLFRLEKNSGLATALNFLLEKVMNNPDYTFIARMDADDISLPDRLEDQRRFLLDNNDISVLGCWSYEIDEAGKTIAEKKFPLEHESIRRRYTTRSPFVHPSVMFSRGLIAYAGFYPLDTILMEDNVLWGNALKAGLKFANLPVFLFKFRKDKFFYKRRSGIKYGWNYFLTRSKIIRLLNLPAYTYFLSFCIGILKMLPSYIIKAVYQTSIKFA